MTRFARWMMIILAGILAAGAALPAVAQDDGVGFEDMTGLQQAVTRTFGSPDDRDVSAGVDSSRDLRKPFVGVLLTAMYRFDTEANASASFALLQTDMTVTGFSGQPLEPEPVTLPFASEYIAGVATDSTGGDAYHLVLAMARDGVDIYTVLAITSGGSPVPTVGLVLNAMASAPVGTGPEMLDPSGGSSGGVWDTVPTLAMVERDYRGIASVEDASLFPV